MKLFRSIKQRGGCVPLLPFAALGFLAAASLPAAENSGAYALKDAKVVRVSGPAIEIGTVLVRDGLIEAVGENIAIPADAWVIDCKGLTVYPGLIDSFGTVGIPGAAMQSSGGGGRNGAAAAPAANMAMASAPVSRGPEDRPSNESYTKAADSISATDPRIETYRNGGILTSVTFSSGKIFNGNGSVINLAGEKPGQMVIADAVGQSIALRASAGYGRSYPGSLMGYVAYVRQIYLDAERYKAAKAIYEKNPQGLVRPAYDRTLEGVVNSARILLPATRGPEIERMVTFAKEIKQPLILVGGQEAYREVDFLKAANVPLLISAKWPTKPMDTDPENVEALRILENREKAPATPGILAKAGVKFAFYFDGIATPKEMLAAVKKAIDLGLSPADALRALTLTPAELFGVSNRLGSVDKGKIANLVVTDGDIFAGATKTKFVFVDGAKFEVPVDAAPAGRGGFGRGGAATLPQDFKQKNDMQGVNR